MPLAQPRQITAAITARPRAIRGSPRNFRVRARVFSGLMATLARVLPSISSTGSTMISSDTPKPGWRGALGAALNSAPSSAGSLTCRRLDNQLPYSGPARITAGTARHKPSSMVRPRSACRALTAISGPGCGGISACRVVIPARAGMAIFSSGRPERRAMTKMIGTIITSPTSKNSGRPMTIATRAMTQGSDLPLPRPSKVEAMRSAAPDSAINAPSIEPRAMMIPASPRIAPAPLLKALATSSGGRPAPTPAMKVPIRIDRNGGSLVALISTMMLAMATRQQMIRRVSWTIQAAVDTSKAGLLNRLFLSVTFCFTFLGAYPRRPPQRAYAHFWCIR